MSNAPTVNKLTGDDVKGTLWGVVGAAAVAVFLAPLLSKYLGIGGVFAIIIAGAAVAYFFSGKLRLMGQGAVTFGLASLAMAYIGPMLHRINPFGGGDAPDSPDGMVI